MTLARAQKIKTRLDHLATYSDRTDCLCREFGSPATAAVNSLVGNWMEESGLTVRVDNIGNVRGHRDNNRPKLFVMGSHLDTVINAGKYDGPLGVLIAIDQASRLNYSTFPHNFEVVGFANEEGVRFHNCYLGSTVVAGRFQESWLATTDLAQVSLEAVIRSIGGNPKLLNQDALPAGSVSGYFEVHIEQGSVLEKLNYPLGVVSHICAQQRHLVCFKGEAGHAGTVPMNDRKDALVAAAEFILAVETVAKSFDEMVATVGKTTLAPGATNIIPEQVSTTLDIRSPHPTELELAVEQLKASTTNICEVRQLNCDWQVLQQEAGVSCDTELIQQLLTALGACDLPGKTLPSWAGHDAVPMSKIAPVSMLFVRCKGGVSHNPLEEASVEDIAKAIDVCDHFLDNLK